MIAFDWLISPRAAYQNAQGPANVAIFITHNQNFQAGQK